MSRPERPPLPDDIVEQLNDNRGGFNQLIGLRYTEASYDTVEAEVSVTDALHQPYGLVHGGVYCAIIETVASTAAVLQGVHEGLRVVGLENATSFLRAARDGTLRARATPLTRGRRTQVWRVDVIGDDGKLAASGKVRLLALPPETEIAGARVDTEGSM